MARIVVAFAAREARRAAAALLEGAGFPVLRTCASGNEVMRAFTLCQDGILVCGARFADATADQVLADLAGRALALVADRPERLALCGLPEEYKLALPAPRSEWLARVEALVRLHEARLPRRGESERALIEAAKARLMEERGLAEPQAHRALQRASMRLGVKMAECARWVLDGMHLPD